MDPDEKSLGRAYHSGAVVFASLPSFWSLPTAVLSGPAAAGGIALINSVGNLSGYVAPTVIGFLKDRTGSYAAGLLALPVAMLAAGLLTLLLLRRDAQEEAG